MNAGKPIRDADLLAHMHLMQRSVIEQLMERYPTARVMRAPTNELMGTIDEGDPMLVEPCDRFDIDGIYLLLVSPSVTILRKLQMMVLQPAVHVESAWGSEVVPLSQLDQLDPIAIVGRVVASCAIRKH